MSFVPTKQELRRINIELEVLVIFLDQEKEIIKPVMTITLHNGMSML
jgi:hypothetical protein